MSVRAAARPSPSYHRAVDDLRRNPGQWHAYNTDGHCVVLAGPGSGKTKTLTTKIAKLLIETIREPRGLACITYSSECARDLKIKLQHLGVYESAYVFIGTVHSFCLKKVVIPYAALGDIDLPNDFRIAFPSDQNRLFQRAVDLTMGSGEPSWKWRTAAESYRRTHLDRHTRQWHTDEQLASLITKYEGLLRAERLIDFEDMVLKGLTLMESHEWIRRALHAKYPAIVIDEYQDLGVPLHRIVESLCFRGGSRLFAVGDPDQSIYGFTGARPELLEDLARSSRVERVHLPFNYRSGPTIVRASEIALGEPRGYEAHGPGVGTVDFYERPLGLADQARFICEELIPSALDRIQGCQLGDIAVLYVDKHDGEVIAQTASEWEYPTIRVDGGAPYPKTPLTRWLEDCAAWCSGGWQTGRPRISSLLGTWASIVGIHASFSDPCWHDHRTRLLKFLLSHRDHDLALLSWLATFGREYLDAVLEANRSLRDERNVLSTLVEAAQPTGVLGAWTVAVFGGQGGSPDHLNLVTLHSAKGREFRVAVMMGMDQGRIPHWKATELEVHEQRRLFYVGLTRAKEEVHMTYSGWTQNQYGRRFKRGPSEFLLQVRDRLQAPDAG